MVTLQRTDTTFTEGPPGAWEEEPALRAAAVRSPPRAADVLLEVLSNNGVEVVFGLPGGAIAPLHDALLDRPDIRVITARHESGAMFAAAGYARATGKLGVVFVTSGPGVLNCVTGLASAWCDGLPVLVLAGEVPRSVMGKGALQEGSAHHLNVVGVTDRITKLALEVTDARAAPAVLQRAIQTALSGRKGPVVLTLPVDVTSTPVETFTLAGGVQVIPRVDDETEAACHEAARALWRAPRPVIFAGSGARWGRGPDALRRLAERLQCPVMTTPKAKGVFPESHPLSLGVFGHGGHPSSTRYLEEGVDVLLAVGTGFSDPATDGWSPLLRPREHLIRVDVDALQIARNCDVTLGLVGEADQVLERVTAHLPDAIRAPRCFGVDRFSNPSVYAHGPEGRITPQRALWELQQALPEGTLYTCDIGEHLLFATHYLHIDDPQGFLSMTGLASMGTSIGGAIGVKLGRPERPVAAVCGDGAFSMCLGDVATAALEGIPLVVAVLNDERYGMVEIGHRAVYGREVRYSMAPMDVGRTAESLGARAIRVERADVIRRLDLASMTAEGPVVLDIRIDRQVAMPKNKRNEALSSVREGFGARRRAG